MTNDTQTLSDKITEEKRGRKKACEHDLRRLYYREKGKTGRYKTTENKMFYCSQCKKLFEIGVTEIK